MCGIPDGAADWLDDITWGLCVGVCVVLNRAYRRGMNVLVYKL